MEVLWFIVMITVYSSDYDNIAMSAVLEVCEDATYTGAGTYTAFNFDATSNTDATATVNNSDDIRLPQLFSRACSLF